MLGFSYAQMNTLANWPAAAPALDTHATQQGGWTAPNMSQAAVAQVGGVDKFNIKYAVFHAAGLHAHHLCGNGNTLLLCAIRLNPNTMFLFLNKHTVKGPNGDMGGESVYPSGWAENNNGLATVTMTLAPTLFIRGDYNGMQNMDVFVAYRKRPSAVPTLLGRVTAAAPHPGPNGTMLCTLTFTARSLAEVQAIIAAM